MEWKKLGIIIVSSSGDGRYSKNVKKTIPMEIFVGINSDNFTYDDNDLIDNLETKFQARFDTKYWNIHQMGLLYTDNGIVDGINKFLSNLGYEGEVSWSEYYMQQHDIADFNMDNKLIHEIWHELYYKLPSVEAESLNTLTIRF